MSEVTYEIIEHDGGWAYRVDGVYSETFPTHEAALKAARERQFDVIISDIGMPDMSGHEVAQALRREPWGAQLHLIALTGWGQESDRARARQAGFDHLVVKPVDPDELDQLIRGGASASRS